MPVEFKGIPPRTLGYLRSLSQKKMERWEWVGYQGKADQIKLAEKGIFFTYGDAFAYRNKAALVLGNSGSGKTFTTRTLRDNLGKDFRILAEDEAILYFSPSHPAVVFDLEGRLWTGDLPCLSSLFSRGHKLAMVIQLLYADDDGIDQTGIEFIWDEVQGPKKREYFRRGFQPYEYLNKKEIEYLDKLFMRPRYGKFLRNIPFYYFYYSSGFNEVGKTRSIQDLVLNALSPRRR